MLSISTCCRINNKLLISSLIRLCLVTISLAIFHVNLRARLPINIYIYIYSEIVVKLLNDFELTN